MAWKDIDAMSQKREFVKLASDPDVNFSELCRRFEVSRKTGRKWKQRFDKEGEDGLVERSRKPKHSPHETDSKIVEAILQVRQKHPRWGARKIHRRLENLGHKDLPAPSTVNGILKRNKCIDEEASRKAKSFLRFERNEPNELWQMDFKGHFPMSNGKRCHPLTVLDDHSRFSIALRALDNEQGNSVKQVLTDVFRQFGLPKAMLMDNGSPWGSSSKDQQLTKFEVWLMQLGIRVIHCRPGHPQTNGKDERFHRTLDVELLQGETFADLIDSQRKFDPFRECYNHERPHQALEMAVPADRYRLSPRSMPEKLDVWEYDSDVAVRKVGCTKRISFRGQSIRIGGALVGEHVGLRPTTTDGTFDVYFRNTKIKTIEVK